MSWLSNLFGGGQSTNPANSAMGYLDQIPGQYTNPNTYNTIESQYHESPGFANKLKRAMEAQKNMAAAGGMSGSLQSQQLGAEEAQNLADQDFQQYLQNRMGISQDLAGVLGQKAQYGYAGQAGQNTEHANFMKQLMGLIGGAGGAALGAWGGGPMGAIYGASQGSGWMK